MAQHTFDNMLAVAASHDKARLLSCTGEHSGEWLTTPPSCEQLKLRNPVMQCLLRRRLGLPIFPEPFPCEAERCTHQIDCHGHHATACTRTGRIHGRHAAATGPWRQILNEAGYRTHVERLISNTHLATRANDQRRMDIVAAPGSRGAGARRGVALFCDVTVVCPLSGLGQARPGTTREAGHVLANTAAKKHRRYADVAAMGGLVVLGCEVYGRWCAETISLVKELAKLKGREAPDFLRQSVTAALTRRWWGLASVGVQRAIGEALLCGKGADLLATTALSEGPGAVELLELHGN